MSSALYYRGPSEPGGDDDIIAEVVDGKLRRGIEISSDGVARCIGFDDYPLAVDMTDVADYVWRISEQEFNEEWGPPLLMRLWECVFARAEACNIRATLAWHEWPRTAKTGPDWPRGRKTRKRRYRR